MPETPASARPRSHQLAWILAALALCLGGTGLATLEANQALLRWIHHAPVPGLEPLWANLTQLGSGWAVAVLLLCIDRRSGVFVAVFLRALVIVSLLIRIPKELITWPRPLSVLDPAALAVIGQPLLGSNSMPSGHTATAAAAAFLCWFAWRECAHREGGPWPPGQALAAMLALALAVGWSRMAVGAHWPSDVLVGTGLGLLGALLATGMERRQPWAPRVARPAGQYAVAGLEVVCALALIGQDGGYPQGLALPRALAALALASALIRIVGTLSGRRLERPLRLGHWRARSTGWTAPAASQPPSA